MAIELLRERALARIEGEARWAEHESRDPRWSRGRGGPNVKRWAERGFDSAAAVIRTLAAEPGEPLAGWLRRATQELARTRELGPDDDDEAWFSSAVDEARRILSDLGGALLSGSSTDLAQFGRLVRRGERFILWSSRDLTVYEGSTRREIGGFRDADQWVVSPDGRVAFVQHAGGLDHIDLDTGATKQADRFGGMRCYIASDPFVVAGTLVLGFLKLWRWDGSPLPSLELDHPDPRMDFGIRALAITPDGRWLAVADNGEDREGGGFLSYERGENPQVRLYDMQSRVCVGRRTLDVHEIAISPDGAVITTRDMTLRGPDLATIEPA